MDPLRGAVEDLRKGAQRVRACVRVRAGGGMVCLYCYSIYQRGQARLRWGLLVAL